MTIENSISKIFGLNDHTWMKHANPWSVGTRFTVLPLAILAVWSRVWIGDWWYLTLSLSIVWAFVNPHLFPKPKSTRNWASRCVLGERVYIKRDKIALPAHHKTPVLQIANSTAAIGLVISIYGVVILSLPYAIIGIFMTIIGKCWFLDRMVWIYLEVKDQDEEFQKWDY
jgi:hypothetical protein